jgi:hypothetical protein
LSNSEITSVLLLNAMQAKVVLEDPYKIKDLSDSIEEYCYDMQTLANLHIELKDSK